MIKLFESTEISFNNNGLGCLNDAITCIVTEKLNGEYELALTYPVDGIHYNDISLDRIIYTKANSYTEQPFLRAAVREQEAYETVAEEIRRALDD